MNSNFLKAFLLVVALGFASEAGAMTQHHVDGKVVQAQPDRFTVKQGNKLFEFEREKGDRDLPSHLKQGDNVTVFYNTDSSNERVGSLYVKRNPRNSRAQQAGEAAPRSHIILDDRAFYGA